MNKSLIPQRLTKAAFVSLAIHAVVFALVYGLAYGLRFNFEIPADEWHKTGSLQDWGQERSSVRMDRDLVKPGHHFQMERR